MGSKTTIYLSTKAMAYKEIEPCARALGMQVLILDAKSYRWNDKLEQKFKTLGISDSEYKKIKYELDDQQAIVILKSKKYYGAPEIAPYFAKFDLGSESIHYMRSINDDNYKIWGGLDADIPPKKRVFLYWIRLDVLDENNDPVLEEEKQKSRELERSKKTLVERLRPLVEHWEPDFDDKPVNQWGESWESLPRSNWLFATLEDAAKDCQIDLFDAGPKLERLDISTVHLLKSGNLIVTIFGGANGGGMRGGCNLKHYLCLVRKLFEKLVGCCKPFADAWLIDWDNDCADDVWTLRFVLKPTDETLGKMVEDHYEVMKLEESNDDVNPDVKFIRDFKKHQGYKDEYFPKYRISDVEASIARECALRMSADTTAREVEGGVVMLLVLSGDEELVKIGKKLGNCMMKKSAKHDEETRLKLMSNAYKRLIYNDAAEKVKEEISKKKHELAKMIKYPKEKVVEAIKYWKNELEKLDKSSFSPVDYQKMWKEFQKLYLSTNGNCDVAFAIDGNICKLIAIVGNRDGFSVKLSRLPKFQHESIPVVDFIKELKSSGLTASKITNIDAYLEGKGYSLVEFSITSGKSGRGLLFDFTDDVTANGFFTEDDEKKEDESK